MVKDDIEGSNKALLLAAGLALRARRRRGPSGGPRRRTCRTRRQGAEHWTQRRDALAGVGRNALRRRDRQGQSDARDGGDRPALWRQRLVARAGRRAEGRVRRPRDRRDRGDRRRIQAGNPSRRHRNRSRQEADHHRLDSGGSGVRGGRIQEGRRRGREAGVHGQCSERAGRRQGLHKRRFGRQLRQRRSSRPADGEIPERQRHNRCRSSMPRTSL